MIGGDTRSLVWSEYAPTMRPFSVASEADNRPEAGVFTSLRPYLRNWFISSVLAQSITFHNYGLRFAKGKVPPQDEPSIRRFIVRAWHERLAMNNVISFWSKQINPQVLRPECADYYHSIGGEVLWYHVRLTEEERAEMSDKEKARYASGRLRLADPVWNANNRNLAETISVWRGPTAEEGLAFPSLLGFLWALGQSDSMEVGENQYAFAYRAVFRHHKIGHEIKTGPKTGDKMHFYKSGGAYAKGLEKAFKGKTGFSDFFDNFDHNWDVLFADPKKYDALKWRTISERLCYWGGAIGMMLGFRIFTPDIFGAVRTQCVEARRDFKPWLEDAIERGFGIPVTLAWDNQCFSTGRLHHEMLKWSVQQGFGSNTTAAGAVFGDDSIEREMEQKKAERRRSEDLLPIFDPNHGQGGAGGKPPLSTPGGRKPREEG